MANFFKCDICGREMTKLDPVSIYKIKIKDLNAPNWEDTWENERKEKHYLCFRCGAKVHKLIMDYKKEVKNGTSKCESSGSSDVPKPDMGKQSSADAGQASVGDLSEKLEEIAERLVQALFNPSEEEGKV